MSQIFGKYIIEKKLGEGGMGAVYLAFDQSLNRKVALKVITSKDNELIERFQREAQSVAKLQHPNIVKVYEAGMIGKQSYFTMDYIEGTSLDKLIALSTAFRKGWVDPKASPPKFQLDGRNIAKIIYQVASAVQYAHSQNVIHRDIKPANILIDKAGRAYIADFGLAKQLTGLDQSLTMTGATIGTPSYMSPEQAMGLKDDIDARSDIFCLGTTLYHCLTGQMPFTGSEIYEVLNKVINEDPPNPSAVMNIVPKDLETICLKAMEKDKGKRYQSASDFASDIKKYFQGQSIKAKRTSRLYKLWVKAKKNKIASFSIAGAAVILISLIVGLAISSANKKREIREYREKIFKEYIGERYDETVALSNKLLALSPQDEEIKAVLKKSQAAVKAREEKLTAEKEAEKAKADKMQAEKTKRAKAKAILDRAGGAPTPDLKIKIAREALEADSSFGDAYQVIGYAYKEKDDYPKAVEFFSKAIEVTPTLAYSYYERALINERVYKKMNEAIPDFEKVLQYDPNSHIGWYAKGNIELNKKEYDKSLEGFTKAIALYSDYADAYVNRGGVYLEGKGELDKAVADFTEAIRLNPRLFEAYANRSGAYLHKGEFDKVIADCTEAIKLNPRSANVYANRSGAYCSKGEFDKAIADCNEALKLDPKYAEAYTNRGISYYNKGELDAAMADLNEAIRLNPEYSKAYTTRAGVFCNKREFEKAIADCGEAIRLDPKDAKVYNTRGGSYSNTREYDKAIVDYSEAIKLDPKYAEAYANRGGAYCIKGELDKAIADCFEAIRLDPKSAAAYIGRGLAYKIKGELDKAIADFYEVISLNSQDFRAWYSLAGAYSIKKDTGKALSNLSKAIELNAQFKVIAKQDKDFQSLWEDKEFKQLVE